MFRIGEFSKIAQVSGRLLRYYEEIGLFSPSFTDPQTGYRYYSAEQLPLLNRILVLKELGLSLEQIAQLLKRDTSPEEIRGMLRLRKAQIEQTLEEEMARLRMVESRLEQMDNHGQMEHPDILLKTVAAQSFLAIRETFPSMSAVRRFVQKINSVVPALVGHSALDYIAVIIHTPFYDPEVFDLEVGFLLNGQMSATLHLPDERVLSLQELPAVKMMATIAHVGPIEQTHRSYGAMGRWIEQNGYVINGTGREILMQLPQPGNEDQAMVEIQIPVVKSDENLGT